ncbi:MAG: HAD-IA family hydrolase [Candidatus Korarchaeota archaeon]|nr:HAD-IA family hydrolase [Candidatus Korarchaeota archaeon]NIU84781.1 HAD-IA family hydrolase [Candidatus Thorarchaeota archaeon]NIW14775.1 HAD-IA family hydrolase [Candidatus Thorarchaeota archaeon]NIW51505.1 HAD-IA family hydrolase [Candidatus Korarchaeota archaeon]
MKSDPTVTIIFDLDGVLLNSEEDLTWLKSALSKTLLTYGLAATEQNLRKLYPGRVRKFQEEVKGFNVDPAKLWKTRDKHYTNEKIYAMKNGEIKPFPDVSELYKLKGRYSLGIITNSPQEVADTFVSHFGYDDLFEVVIGRGTSLDDLTKLKPNPHLFKKLKEEHRGDTVVYVGDRESDRKFAENTGMKFLHLTRDKNGLKNLKEVVSKVSRGPL